MDELDVQSIDNIKQAKCIVFENYPDYLKFQAIQRYLELGGDKSFIEHLLFETDLPKNLKISISILIDDYQTLVRFNESIGDPIVEVQSYLLTTNPLEMYYAKHGITLTNEFAYLVSHVDQNLIFSILEKYHFEDTSPCPSAQYLILNIKDKILLSSLKFLLPPCYQSDLKYQLKRVT